MKFRYFVIASLLILLWSSGADSQLQKEHRNAQVFTSTGGTLVINAITLGTVSADYDLPDRCDAATGAWATLIARDAEVVSLTVTDTSDSIVYKGLSLDANDELDSAGAAQDHVTVVCIAANTWYAVDTSGAWVDGLTAD